MTENVNGGGILDESFSPLLRANGIDNGVIQVFREFIPQKDVIEYTVFFRKNFVKYRLDIEATEEEIFSVVDSAAMGYYLLGRIIQAIKDGQCIEASRAVQ